MTAESMKLYKLIILYFLSKTKQDITNAILSDFILEYGYTDYFSIQETLTALTEDAMISARQTHTTCYYTLTEKGQETLHYFCYQLPKDTIQQIDDYLMQHKMQIVKDTSVRTDYTKISSTEYLFCGAITERGSTLLEVSLAVPSEDTAVSACRRFRENSEDIYGFLLEKLSKD